MTAREILDGLSETLMCDERILSVLERELLTNLLQRTQTNGSTRDNAVAESIARAVGETIAQRAYAVLGNSITQRLSEPTLASSSGDAGPNAIVAHSGGLYPPAALKGPSPPAPLKGPSPPRPLKGPSPPGPN